MSQRGRHDHIATYVPEHPAHSPTEGEMVAFG